ncbi:2-succinyl-5-enolpyruvyl-6-hydroxy-3-cyclohexene-1-carboxylic-acid synthase [Sandaracinus amylolyticus]|uniref:2-succinyl-5-enolpyruvyl-6-hydroxy-3-cyclohexene-1-carboxylate synthase n=1 Tax=Sandaracinus amylolyticus TaxID=927083 RepID=A0A0F6WAE4_9BACT|nr:2-succinyl-5-enolpyruvyl-6-hydroxy-3-cyclohexene-1-carboxylic-acid synthase [Sandaracinus amylolyticus]AKF11440.1 2-succinyl-5-enolpyruvyl-6-hydroxy-3-cyclohexene-1-carboxylic-acid synthase [Sandaracinus amylolyticus]
MNDLGAPATLLGEWARIVASALVESGVREVVISPGSRSTPFVIAISAREEMRVVDVLDERSAAFVALGMARASARPVALLCTSGTAPAHWYPAIIEASLSDIPLVCLSADRPFEHAHCGAAQTIDQIALFGSHVRFFAEVGAPDASESALFGLRRTVAQAVARSRDPRPGPVHLNLRARKPLEPRAPETPSELALRARVDRVLATPLTRAASCEVVPAIDEAVALLARARRPWIVAGPMPAHDRAAREATLAIARTTGAPLFAESTSQLRFGSRDRVVALDALDLALRVSGDDDLPDVILQLGATPTSSAYERFVARHPEIARIVAGASDWTDPHGSARVMLLGDRGATLRALASSLPVLELDMAWRDRWVARERRAWHAIEAHLEESSTLGEGTVARATVRALPRGAYLSIGNSLPIRTVDRYVRGGEHDVAVLCQRGANGIDGLVSGAIGASIATGTPGALMLGDLSLLHDVGGLASARLVSAPLAIVVVQNGGGRIFEQLPVASVAPWAMTHFTLADQGRPDLAHAAALFGLGFARVSDAPSLHAALERALVHEGVTIIEAIVPPHGAHDADADVERRLRELET